MSGTCPSGFEQRLLTGSVDGELTQQDEQRVRLHLEQCATCRTLARELRDLREVTMSTRFSQPTDLQWSEAPRSGTSLVARRLGWLLVGSWLTAIGAFAAWELATGPGPTSEKLVAVGGILGVALLLLSVVLDRVRDARTDRYRRVER